MKTLTIHKNPMNPKILILALLGALALIASSFAAENMLGGERFDGGATRVWSTESVIDGKVVQKPKVLADGTAYESTATKTRPADTAGYAAGEVINESASAGTNWTFAAAGPEGGTVLITGATLRIDLNAVTSGMGTFRLHLYDAAPTAINDSAAYNLPSGDRAKYLGYVDIPTPKDLGDTLWAQEIYVRQQVKLAAGSSSIFAMLESVGAYTGASATVYTVDLRTVKVSE